MTYKQELSLKLIKKHFENISYEEFLESYFGCEKNIGPTISTFGNYLKENISSNCILSKRISDENSKCDQCEKDILKGEEILNILLMNDVVSYNICNGCENEIGFKF